MESKTPPSEQPAAPSVADPGSNPLRAFVSILGSLWIAALLLMLLLVAMACATFFESRYGLAYARDAFYESWWFQGLLFLATANIIFSMLVRMPLTWKRTGFILTHGGLLVIVVGAMMTGSMSIDGVLALQEGTSASEYRLRADALTLRNRQTGETAVVDFPAGQTGGFDIVEDPDLPALTQGDILIEVDRYLPDSRAFETVQDDNPRLAPAVEVSVVTNLKGGPQWLFAGREENLGGRAAKYRYIPDAKELAELVEAAEVPAATSVGSLSIDIEGQTYTYPVEACSGRALDVGKTGYKVEVLEYYPHAQAGTGGKLTTASNRPENPAVTLELTGPGGVEQRNCFAKFPDFVHTTQGERIDAVDVLFEATSAVGPEAPIEILGGPDGALHVRFFNGTEILSQPLTLGQKVDTPWPKQTLTVHRRFDHARTVRAMELVTPVRENRQPAVRLNLTAGDFKSTMWAPRGFAYPVTIGGVPYDVIYGDQIRPLGFTVKLHDFAVRFYPGGGSPRAFESEITITDPATGTDRRQKVSMNHPAKYGGLTLFQSSYQLARGGRGRDMSIFSVARDPGLPVVFAGYVVTFLGMVWVLMDRVREQRRLARLLTQEGRA